MTRRWFSLLAMTIAWAAAGPAFAQSFVVSNYATFTNALAASNAVINNFQRNAQIVVPPGQTIEILTNLTVDGGTNNVIFSGSNVTRIFHVHAKATNTLVNLQLYNGCSTLGGAIFNEGALVVSNCVFAGNVATNTAGVNGKDGAKNGNGTPGTSGAGAVGGAIYSKGPLTILFSTFTNNTAKAGNGGNGGNGITQFVFGGDGGDGGNGGAANGGAVYSLGSSNFVFATLFENNNCVSGAGGLGGSPGAASFSGQNGKGGIGGTGYGGAFFCGGVLRMGASFFQANSVTAGASAPGQGGAVGGSALGGAIYVNALAAASLITNCTMLGNSCAGGLGGNALGSLANAGAGGGAFGGAWGGGAAGVIVVNCTIATNLVKAGAKGVAQGGGHDGASGAVGGAQIYETPGSVRLLGTIVSGGPKGATINTVGAGDGGFNLSSDTSGVGQATSLANRNPLLSATVAVITSNIVYLTNFPVVTNVNFPTTNFVPPVQTNFVSVTNNLNFPTNLPVFNLVTNVLGTTLVYSYNLITSYTYTNTAGMVTQSNIVFTTNFLAGNNGGPTPTLAFSSASPALNFVTGIPGISFPLLDQRLYFRVSPTAIGAFDPNAVPALTVTNPATSNKFTFSVPSADGGISFPTLYTGVTSFTIDGTNLTLFFGSATNFTSLVYSNNIQIITNGVFHPETVTNYFARDIPTPIISPTDEPHVVGMGQGAMFTASLGTNIPGIGFQWQLNGTNLAESPFYAGTTTSNLVLKAITKNAAGNYTVIAGTTLAFCNTSAVYQVIVTNLPTVAFVAPVANARTPAQPALVRGTVTMGPSVTGVNLWVTNLNDGSVQNVPTTLVVKRGAGAWSGSFSPAAGTNVLAAWADDDLGFQSPVVTRRFFSVQTAPVSLTVVGSGVIAGAKNNARLNVGQTYTLVARPAAGWLFGHWEGAASGENATTQFLMEPDAAVTATFVRNMFLTATGVYNGLFYNVDPDTNSAGPLGMVSGLTLTKFGAYSAKVVAWGFQTNHSITGVFNATSGMSTASFVSGTNTLALQMTIADGVIRGTVSNNNIGPSVLFMERTMRTNFTGAYTLALRPEDTNGVPGIGYGMMTNRLGSTVVSGTLADGTPFSQAVGVSSSGAAPLFVPIYTNGGVVAGWIVPGQTYDLFWIKPAGAGGLYPAGFTNFVSAENSLWKAPRARTPAISLPNGGTLTFSDGDLAAPITATVVLNNNTFLVKANNQNPTNSVIGTINPQNGQLSVTFGNGNGNAVTTAKGVLLQDATNGAGFFLGPTNSGAMILTPNPEP